MARRDRVGAAILAGFPPVTMATWGRGDHVVRRHFDPRGMANGGHVTRSHLETVSRFQQRAGKGARHVMWSHLSASGRSHSGAIAPCAAALEIQQHFRC